jgi:predicted TPR repeat methyltransferase
MDDTESGSRELTLDEAVTVAIVLQNTGRLEEAQELYQHVLQAAPDFPRALHFAGVLAHQQQRNDEALTLIARSLELHPGEADWYSNLGIVYQATGEIERAIDAYQHAIALDPGHANAYSNLGVVLRASGKPVDAERAYRTAIQLNPQHIDAYHNLGILLAALDRTREAAACFCKVITLRPKHRDARRLLALAHATVGELDEAVRVLQEWLDEEPGNPVALHMLAACSGRDVPRRASDQFVERTFDSFATSFESKLQQLSYRAPRLIAALLEESGLEADGRLDVLDAGCGTGLCGPLVAPYARRLTGVDLSSGMLARAEEKRIYDALMKSELTDYLRQHPEAFDLIVAADALVYFGDLEGVLASAAQALRPDGLLIFTLEHAAESSGTNDYRLEFHGRYSHTSEYVERLLAASALEPTITRAELRLEGGVPVDGLLVRARKPSERDVRA